MSARSRDKPRLTGRRVRTRSFECGTSRVGLAVGLWARAFRQELIQGRGPEWAVSCRDGPDLQREPIP